MGAQRGWKVAGYVAEELIGHGSTGQVWRGRIGRSGHAVALKRIDCSEPAGRRSAQAEAALLSALDHPHLVRLHEVVTDGDALVLVLDLADGGSLADLLARRDRLTPGEVVTALAPVAAALAYAHDEGVTHSDVSPANVLFTAAGVPLLADLGTARLLGDTSRPHATLAYLDPSVAGGAAPSAPGDVFALAAVALHALSGRPPWAADSAEQLMELAAAGDIADLDQRLAGLPGALADVVRRGLSWPPHARGTAAEFALDLRHAVTPVPIELAAGRSPLRARRQIEPHPQRQPEAESPHQPPHQSPHQPRHAHVAEAPGRGPRRSPRNGGPPARARPLDRPPFPRPEEDTERSSSVAAALTHTVRARARPPAPPPTLTHRITSWVTAPHTHRRPVIAAVTVVLLSGLGAAAFVFWPPRGGPATAASSSARAPSVPPSSAAAPSTTAAVPTTTAAVPSTTVPVPSTTVPVPTPVGWAAVLSGLDAAREQAFASNDPAKLALVYAPGELLRQDVATLARLVRPGCRVDGLHTSYAGVVLLARTPSAVSLRATAALTAARVVCGSVVSAHTSALPRTQLTIGLRPVADGYRITSLRVTP